MTFNIVSIFIALIAVCGGFYLLGTAYSGWRFPIHQRERTVRSLKAGIGLTISLYGICIFLFTIFSNQNIKLAEISPVPAPIIQSIFAIFGTAAFITCLISPVILGCIVGTYIRIGFAEKISKKLDKYQIK